MRWIDAEYDKHTGTPIDHNNMYDKLISWVSFYPPGKNISFSQGTFENAYPFPKVGYFSSLEGIQTQQIGEPQWRSDHH